MHISRIAIAVVLPSLTLASPISNEARALGGLGGLLGGLLGGGKPPGTGGTPQPPANDYPTGSSSPPVDPYTPPVLPPANPYIPPVSPPTLPPLPGTGSTPDACSGKYHEGFWAAVELIKKTHQIPTLPSDGPGSDDNEYGYTKRQTVDAPNALGMGVPVTIPITITNDGGIADGLGKGGIIKNTGGILNSKDGFFHSILAGFQANNALPKLQNLDLGGLFAR